MVMLRPRTDASKLLRRVLQGMNGWVRRSSLAAGLAIGIVGDAGVRPAFFLELNGGFEPPSRFSTTEEVSLEDYAESCMTPRDLLWCLTLMTEIRFLFGRLVSSESPERITKVRTLSSRAFSSAMLGRSQLGSMHMGVGETDNYSAEIFRRACGVAVDDCKQCKVGIPEIQTV